MKWYPQDCDSDEVVKSMSDEEFGFYIRCLNHAWVNDGIPADISELASVMGRQAKYVQRIWKKVGLKWTGSPKNANRLVNQKQEDMRYAAKEKSEKARNSVNSRYERSSFVERPYNERKENVTPRAYVSDSNSSVLRFSSEKKECEELPDSSQRFEEWWGIWSASRGTNHYGAACQAWLSTVTAENIEDVFECTRSYIGSRRNSSGYNPETFLFDQFRDSFQARWPAAGAAAKTASSDFWGAAQ